MKKYNVIVVYNKDKKYILMCLRQKDPFQGLYNFVGGKVNPDETDDEAAYRELYEETHISKQDIHLIHTHDFCYYLEDMMIQVYVGILSKDIDVFGDENPLKWISLEEDFFDVTRFAGLGNIGHILKSIALNQNKLI